MKKYGISLLALVSGFILGGVTLYALTQQAKEAKDFDTVPTTVESKYQDVVSAYGTSIGATLSRCSSPEGAVFIIRGSSGFTGETFYYSKDGNLLGSTSFSDDDPASLNQAPPVEFDENSCVELRSTTPPVESAS